MTSPTGASNEVTVDAFKLYGCRLDEPPLEQLINVVCDPAASPPVTVETTLNGTRHRQAGLASLKAATLRSFNPGDRRQLDNLRVEARHADRRAMVELGKEVASVSVESEDSTWAVGKAERIRRIFRHSGGRAKPWRWRPSLCATATGVVVTGLLAVLWMFGLAPAAGLDIALVGGAAAAAFLLARRMLRRSRPVIWIDGSLPRHGWREWSVGDRIAFLALLAAIIVPFLAK
jgi:hypothetical protein